MLKLPPNTQCYVFAPGGWALFSAPASAGVESEQSSTSKHDPARRQNKVPHHARADVRL